MNRISYRIFLEKSISTHAFSLSYTLKVELVIDGTNLGTKIYKTITEVKGYRTLRRPQRSGENPNKDQMREPKLHIQTNQVPELRTKSLSETASDSTIKKPLTYIYI
jgi:hypothetical protein